MKKINLILLAIATFGAIAPAASAQMRKTIEVGGGMAITGIAESKEIPEEKIIDMSSNLTPSLYAEFRFSNSEKFDFGVQVSASLGTGKAQYRTYRDRDDDVLLYNYQQMKFTSIGASLLGVADYYFAPGNKVNPYIGLGAGAGYGHRTNDLNDKEPNTITFVPMARLGLDFGNIRVAAVYRKWFTDGPFYSNVGITIGWTKDL